MPDDFSLPQSSWAELKKMIEAYFLEDKRSGHEPVKVPEVAQRAAMDATLVSRNNKFFQAVGVIAKGQKKRVTEDGRALGLALSHGDDPEICRHLATLVNESDFLSRIQSAVKVRNGMDSESLERHIAITAGAAKSSRTSTGARAVVEMLVAAGALEQDESGTFRAGQHSGEADDPESNQDEVTPNELPLSSRVRLAPAEAGQSERATSAQHVTVNITINVESGGLAEVEPFLRELTGLNRPEGSDGQLD